MANLNYAVQYSQALSQAFPYVLNFGALYNTPNNSLYKVTGADTIKIPVLRTTGGQNANRDTIIITGKLKYFQIKENGVH